MSRIALLAFGLILSATATAQDFTAVKIEAENFNSKHSDWRLTSRSNTPNVRPDPDGSHAASASGGAYMELLPDTRVSHGDRLVSGGNFWNTAGTGPSLSYNVNIPEAGRYLVFVKAYSTGTEDNGIHVGLNNSNPASGQRMQWCSGKNKWTWSSAQRTASNHCGRERTIYLDFSFAGANKVTFSAREDGFEFDQFILLKTNNNSCKPNDNDQIACNNGTTSVNTTTATPVATPVATPEVTPVATPVVTPVATPVATPTETTATETTTPVCSSSDSDPDGDGWGWEDQRSCLVGTVVTTQSVTTDPQTGVPVCASSASDPDGDGWGWEDQRSCLVSGAAAEPEFPTCTSASSDADGDGWGWENARSCLVQ